MQSPITSSPPSSTPARQRRCSPDAARRGVFDKLDGSGKKFKTQPHRSAALSAAQRAGAEMASTLAAGGGALATPRPGLLADNMNTSYAYY